MSCDLKLEQCDIPVGTVASESTADDTQSLTPTTDNGTTSNENQVDEPAVNSPTNQSIEGQDEAKKTRSKRTPYQTATPIQLELLINGRFHENLSISAAARRAGIARSTAASLLNRYKSNNGVIPARKHRGRTAPPTLLQIHSVWIDNFLQSNPDATLEIIRRSLLEEFPSIESISISALQRHINLKCTNHLKRSRRPEHGFKIYQ
ncbi:hypothetical protein DM01DRAFT_1338996 [Hesseltinella vesiculosa]|uniref:Paired domain-containing protein n=1 Tax=Hesseltinella vesiculosa TaxID=101127 RepID=A0A1X2G8J4_9FUNG|nr:hypothetical protein DM01DRAFT_1338996 [Hesseltinella vesiculosa]